MAFPAVEAFRGSDGLTRVVGHRGARGVLPENSMIGFEFAVRTGAHLIEFDVVMTSDNVPIITHNTTLHAPTFRFRDGQFLSEDDVSVASLTWNKIQEYEIGKINGASPYGARFPDQAQIDGVRVPRLIALLRFISHPENSHANLMLELKSDPEFSNDANYRERMVRTVLEEVRTTGLQDRVLLHSFDWNILTECQRQAPEIPTSFLTQLPENEDEIGEDSAKSISPDLSSNLSHIPELVREAGGHVWCPYISDVTAEDVLRAKHLGLCVVVWTVNETEDIDRMIEMNVDAIVSDYPGHVQRRLADLGLRWV